MPGLAHTAHLIPENPEGKFWQILPPTRPSELELNFSAFIAALEGEFSRAQRSRKIDAVDRAFLIRVEKSSASAGGKALDELKELAASCGVSVFDAVMQVREKLDPRYVMGRGKLADVVIRAMQMDANLLIFDQELTPAQVRAIADFTEMKVIDRTQSSLTSSPREPTAGRARSRWNWPN